ncbi:MAG: class I SAM-dependent methyltransferase, partial [Chloroflexi bacterium]|nr:class I SAM-dependent methyltransferase [Chloroflexota bacterium]
AEVERILRPGGLFAAYDYSWPPTVHWEAEAAYDALTGRVDRISREQGIEEADRNQYWPKEQHLSRMIASGRFRYVKEILAHHMEMGNAERFIGLSLSNYIGSLLRRGLREEDIGFDQYKATVQKALGEQTVPFYFSYQVRIGIK